MAIPEISSLHVRVPERSKLVMSFPMPLSNFQRVEPGCFYLDPCSPLIFPALSKPHACVKGSKAILREGVQGISGVPTEL